jgi:bifunctional UDP-N-acetylglucosamine pyrophosphorylase/glucosamine-1-phosphate N-acetyltransferase
MHLHIVILAAGRGTRMKSALPKVLHRIAGIPIIDYVLRSTFALEPETMTVVIGHQAEVVRAQLLRHPGIDLVVQEPQLGTAHALRCAEPALRSKSGTLVLVSGDVPLLTSTTLKQLVDRHSSTGAAATVLTAFVTEPGGYGRIVRSGERIARIVEDKDTSLAERDIHEINTGIYAFALDGLFETLEAVASDNAQREFYLPDVVAIYRKQGKRVETLTVGDSEEIRGINSRLELAEASRIVTQAKNTELMMAGVTLEDPATTYVDRDVVIGPDTVLHPGVFIEGTTTIGSQCEIHSGARLVNSRISDRVTIYNHSVLTDVSIEEGVTVGPFAHLRSGASVGAGAKLGNFVEAKKTTFGAGSKAMHLSYLGDAVIGPNVNIGAGTITCNYDGTQKHTTTIEEGAFIGSDTQLVAPVTVGKGAYVGTGTTIRENVPAGALAVSAGKQRNIEGWVEEKRKNKTNKK